VKIVCIYGGVGVGKRTIGEQVAKLTGFTLFHNHLTIDPALVLIPMKTKSFFPIVNQFRFALLRAAAKRKLKGVIVTSGWDAKEKNAWIEGLKRIGHEPGNKLYFAHIHCDEKTHTKRVRGESRKLFKKSRNAPEILADRRKKGFSTPHTKQILSLDTTGLSPRASARLIVHHYKL
jgi:hypothetical protein